MKSVQLALFTLLSVALSLGILGCSSESDPAAAPETAAPGTSAEPDASASAAATSMRTPVETAEAFMEAGMAGDEAGVNALLTAKAVESIQADDGQMEIHDMPFDEYTVGESEETDDGHAVAVETIEGGEVTNVKLLMREEDAEYKIFGVAMDLGDGMSFTINLENIEDMLGGMVEGMTEALEESFSDAFEGMSMAGTEEQIAAKKAQFDALAAVSLEDYEASWKNTKDYAGGTVGDALIELAAGLGLTIHAAGAEEALSQEVSASVAGLSKLEAIEMIAAENGLVPVYPEAEFGMGALGDAMVNALSASMESALEQGGIDLDAAREAAAAEEPAANAIQFEQGERTLPIVFDGPFAFEVTDLTENAPMPTGEIAMVVRAYGLNLGILNLLSNDSDSTIFHELVDAQGRSLIEENVMYMSGGEIFGSGYSDRFGLDLMNLIREVEVIASFSGTQRISIPTEVETVTFDGIAVDETLTVGELVIKVLEAGSNVRFEITGPETATEDLIVTYWAFNEAGETEPINFDYTDSWQAGKVQAQMDLAQEPHSVQLKLITQSETIEYPFAFENVPLQKFSEAPEKIEALSFEGHEEPVTITMKEITDPDPSFGEADFTLVNHSNKDILSIFVSMEYYDASGTKLEDFPSTLSGTYTQDGQQSIVTAGATNVHAATTFNMPEGTTEIRTTINSIEFSDGTSWEGDNGF